MILTCPECATRYFVDDARVGPKGREVRCASCGHRWTAMREDQLLELADSPEIGAVGDEPPPPPPPAPHETPADELPKAFRQKAQTRLKEREAAKTGVVWAAVAGGAVVLVGAVIFLRQDIAQIWPRTAGVYAKVGLPVNLIGLTIENQHAQPKLKDGHADLAISGVLRNIRGKPVTSPPLRVTLLASDGRVVATQIANPGEALVPPGDTRRFVVDVLDPPVSATDGEIDFVVDTPATAGKKHAPAADRGRVVAGSPPPATLQLRGAAAPASTPTPASPEPQDAKPLPSSSPYALPSNANLNPPHG